MSISAKSLFGYFKATCSVALASIERSMISLFALYSIKIASYLAMTRVFWYLWAPVVRCLRTPGAWRMNQITFPRSADKLRVKAGRTWWVVRPEEHQQFCLKRRMWVNAVAAKFSSPWFCLVCRAKACAAKKHFWRLDLWLLCIKTK